MHRFWTTAQLLALGRSERQRRAAIADGVVLPVRKGIVALPGTPEPLIRAARVGGVLTGPSAARALGLWTPPDPADADALPPSDPDQAEAASRLHVAAARRDHRLRDPDDASRPLGAQTDVVVHRVPGDAIASARLDGIAPVLMVLQHVFAVLEPAWALAVLESALQQRHLLEQDRPALAAALPPRLRPVVAAADGRAESGLETIVRVLLRVAGLRVDVLVHLPGIGTVDLLVEGRLIVELDGRAWHDDREAFARDRRRDLVAATSAIACCASAGSRCCSAGRRWRRPCTPRSSAEPPNPGPARRIRCRCRPVGSGAGRSDPVPPRPTRGALSDPVPPRPTRRCTAGSGAAPSDPVPSAGGPRHRRRRRCTGSDARRPQSAGQSPGRQGGGCSPRPGPSPRRR